MKTRRSYQLCTGLFTCLFLLITVGWKRSSLEQRVVVSITKNESCGHTCQRSEDEIFQSRRLRLVDQCQTLSLAHPEISDIHSQINNFKFFVYNNTGHMFCYLLKSGSNSFSQLLDRLRTKEQSAEISINEPIVSQKCWPGCAQNYTKLLLVRHPFERLLSAWRYLFTRDSLPFGITHAMSWPDFVDKIIHDPTKEEVWNKIKAGAGAHWQPYWSTCSVCHELFHPHYIIKMETLDRDIRILFKKADAPVTVPHLLQGEGGHSSQLVRYFFSQLSSAQVCQLLKRYRPDFDLFDYSFDDFNQHRQHL